MKKLTVLLLIMAYVFTSFSVLAASTYANADSVIEFDYVQSEKVGNIFSAKDTELKFSQTYKNIASETATVNAVYQVLDEDGTLVGEYSSQSLELLAGKTASLDFIVENPAKYGLYTLKVINTININGSTYEKTYEEGFSVCIDIDKNSVDPDFGFSQQIISKSFGDAEVTSALMRKAGATWYREDVMTWSMVEKQKGVYKIPDGTKEKLQKIKDSGIKVVCILNGTNGALYSFPKTSASIDAFVEYCKFVARELDGLVDHYEIWNEWNKKMESDTEGYYLRTDVYAEVVKRASKALKEIDENNTIIGCVTAGIECEWIDGVLTSLEEANALDAMDAISVHCYPWSRYTGVVEDDIVGNTQDLKVVLENHSLDIPLWLTEVGFSTYEKENYFADVWMEPCTEEQQLNALVMVNALNKAYGLYDKLIQYSFHDRANKKGIESNWGIVNCWQRGYTENAEAELTPYGAKPAYLGIAAMNYFIGGNTEFTELIKNKNDKAYAIKFKNNNLKKNVMLCINGNLWFSTKKTIDLDASRVQVYDKYGNFVKEEVSDDGTFTFNISQEPMYVTWAFEESVEEEENLNFLNVVADNNTNTVTISGVAVAPGDLVSVMVVSKGEATESYDSDRVLYVGQAKADDYSRYSLSFVVPEFKGQFEVYANTKLRKDKQMDELVFTYTIPEIKVSQNDTPVNQMSDIDTSSPVDIELRGFTDLTDEKPVLVVAQYSRGKLMVTGFDTEAIGDCTVQGAEIKRSFEVEDGVDKIKVMYMNTICARPLVASYEIK